VFNPESSLVAWSDPPPTLMLAANEVHVWRASLNCEPSVFSRLESSLSPDERARADHFVYNVDRSRFVMARGILRELLGRYLERPANTINFSYGSYGKPEISQPQSPRPIRFNLSHSHGLALFAVALNRTVGIDLEMIRKESAGEDIAARHFSSREIEELGGLPVDQRVEGFFLCWTRKEAYLKATGDGLRISLDSFDVSLSPGRPATLATKDGTRWSLESFALTLNQTQTYVGALATETEPHTTECFEWKPKYFK
jgi:4'-phosphopantetheinyl transferase